jgi:hypothetical protein
VAQTQADSLMAIAEKSSIDTTKVHLYNQICYPSGFTRLLAIAKHIFPPNF